MFHLYLIINVLCSFYLLHVYFYNSDVPLFHVIFLICTIFFSYFMCGFYFYVIRHFIVNVKYRSSLYVYVYIYNVCNIIHFYFTNLKQLSISHLLFNSLLFLLFIRQSSVNRKRIKIRQSINTAQTKWRYSYIRLKL